MEENPYLELYTFYYSPMIETPNKFIHKAYITNTKVTIYKWIASDENCGKYFFYMCADPGLFDDYQWCKCSAADMKLEDNVLHFYTINGSHYAFELSDLPINEESFNKLKYVIDNM